MFQGLSPLSKGSGTRPTLEILSYLLRHCDPQPVRMEVTTEFLAENWYFGALSTFDAKDSGMGKNKGCSGDDE